MDGNDRQDRAYLSVLAWPDGADDAACVEALVAAAGLDPYLASQAARRGVPQVVCLIDALIAPEVVRVLRARGIRAAAPTRSAMEGLPAAIRCVRVGRPRSRAHLLAVGLFDRGGSGGRGGGGETVEFDPGGVGAVVRATIATTRVTFDTRDTEDQWGTGLTVAGGLGAVALTAMDTPGGKRSSTMRVEEVVEVQLHDGRRFRFDGRRFEAGDDERLRSGQERMDRLAVLLGEACPGAEVDLGFREFRCPPDVLRSASSVTGSRIVRTRDDWPLFEFYSAWRWLAGRSAAR
jgi:hypothetical protein